jgi:O-acetyl-ADP-ribose deacetylase (regulator of RNase III)
MLRRQIGEATIEVVQGDITAERTEAVVNAANEGLRGGGGVDGAIHRAGGPQILAECRQIGRCPTGQAAVTTGGRLYARYVIHTVGPIWRGGGRGEAELLASCYQESLKLAQARGLKSLSFPSISTGAYGYPKAEAARVAIGTAAEYLGENPGIGLVRFVVFSPSDLEAYRQALEEVLPEK